MAGMQGYTALEMEALKRKLAGEKVTIADGPQGATIMPEELAAKESQFSEALASSGGEVTSLDWGEAVPSPDVGRLDAIYKAAGVSAPVASEPTPEEKVAEVGKQEVEDGQTAQVAAPIPGVGVTCIRCGYVQGEPLVEVPTKEDMIEFVQSILGSRRMHKVISFFDGNFKVKYRSLLVSEYDVIRQVVRWMIREGLSRVMEDDAAFYQQAVAATSVVEITTPEGSYKVEPLDVFTIYEKSRRGKKVRPQTPEAAVHTAIVDKLSEYGPKVAIFTQGSFRAEELYKMLIARAYDQNFWNGVSVQ